MQNTLDPKEAICVSKVSCKMVSATSGLLKNWKLKVPVGREDFWFLAAVFFLGIEKSASPLFLKQI